ncbi:IPT/TIG domain-containing protein [Tepidibacter aestuarii]|uniref:IPT/TIG domain-containing protein n=1 Tax=Tepidibacter aestuarii TaxID=2925782 RepID=UPI0020BFE7E6|nr:IPT/TIG domain-containing protein [Tepidibacter aestuarii]CAH2215089.1 IPT/TIG domain-containing protein [Tepidibacter aestuarii]
MKRINWIKRVTSFILVFMMAFGMMPWHDMKIYAYDSDKYYVDYITITKIYEEYGYTVKQTRLTVHGGYLQGVAVGTDTDFGYKEFKNADPNTDSVVEFIVEGDIVGNSIDVGSVSIPIDQSGIPSFSNISKRNIKAGVDTLTINGSNLDKIGTPGYSAYYQNETQAGGPTDLPLVPPNKPEEVVTGPLSGTPGFQNIVVKKEEDTYINFNNNNALKITDTSSPNVGKNRVKLTIRNTYPKQFRLINEITATNLVMNPNRGEAGTSSKIGDEVIFTADSGLDNYDVFFLKSLSNKFTDYNKGVDTTFKPDVDGKQLLKTHLPNYRKDVIENGEYYVVITNKIPEGKNPEDYVTKSYVLPEMFTIIDAKQKMKVVSISPDSGPDTGSKAEISGVFFGTLNIPDLKLNENTIDVQDPVSGDQILDITYGKGSDGVYKGGTYKGDTVTSVTREVKVIVGGIATFATNKAQTEYENSFTNALDKISIITPQVTDAEDDPVKDVVIETITTIKIDGKSDVVIKDRAELLKSYTYIASTMTPVVNYITPDKIQVEKISPIQYDLKEDMLVSIEGNRFLIHKYTKDDGTEVVRYPVIEIGNDIRLNKNNNGLDSNEDLYLKIFDRYGRELDGSQGNEIGTRIIVKIPKDSSVTNIGKTFVKVINPVKHQETEGLSALKTDAVEFVVAGDKPIINSVKPNIVTVDGGENVVIEGNNFDRGVKVFIDGKEVGGINREGDGKKITFKSPPGREGSTQIQVMNPSGAIAISEFIYVTTYTDPKIISFSPNKGSNGTLVVVKGDNFLKPQPSTSDIDGANIFKVIGTRILIGDEDINSYNKDSNNKIILSDYESLDTNKVIYMDNNKPNIRDYYQSIILSENDTINMTGNSFYTFDINTKGDITLSNGKDENYTVTKQISDDKFRALLDSGKEYDIDVYTDKIKITETGDTSNIKELHLKTPYIVQDNVITGHRVKVINKNEIYFTVPMLDVEKWYDLTVQNPDTQYDKRTGTQGFYYYKTPKKNPTIVSIEPDRGSTEGGYTAYIYGSDFESNGDIKSRIFIGGVEADPKEVVISTDRNKITIIIPKYPGNLKEEIDGDRKTVPVVVTNSDGGNYSKEDGFTYVIPTSNPQITKILPNTASAAGGDKIQIWGTDFRYFEPYEDTNGNAAYDKAETYEDANSNGQYDEGENYEDTNSNGRYDYGEKYQDLNGNDKWDNLENKDEYEALKTEYENLDPDMSEEERASKDYRNILPKIYFGKNTAEIVDFSDGYISVEVPVGEKGDVDVYVLNNDFGTSNKVNFTYKSSSPVITKVVPNIGKKKGEDNIEIHGSEFNSTKIKVLTQLDVSKAEEKEMPVVRFGDINDVNISNISIDAGKLNAGTIIGTTGNTQVGDLEVQYDSSDKNNKKINLTARVNDKDYTAQIINYNDEEIYVSLRDVLVHNDGSGIEKYPGYELVKIKIDAYARRIIVERGYSPETNLLNSGQVEVKTPSYYTIGKVPVTIINPDKGEASGEFEYKNPDSFPKITEITRDGQPSVPDNINGKDVKVVKVNYKGGSIISVIGSDFRENAKISIGDVMEIDYANITPTLPNKLTFKIDAVDESEVGKLHKVVVQNEDGAFASSDEPTIPIYIMFTKGETSPKIDSITPDKGLSKGGDKVVIKGLDFRKTMEGYEPKKIAVYFGEKKVPEEDITFIDYKTIEVITPKYDPKTVDVKIENPDGEISNSVEYTYLSDPDITQIVDAKDNSINISTIFVDGGQEIQIKGNDFMSGARVVFSPVLKEATASDTDTITIDGKNYVLVSGTDGDVEFIDSQNLKVTTPPGKLGTKGVMIVNPDKAGSNIYDVVYVIDQIDAPTGVNAELIYDKYIKINWNEVKDATSYEIYAVEDDKEMYLVGTTDLTTFIYRDVKPKTDYRFIIKAIGEFGLSKGSSKSNEVTTKSGSGYDDKDGEINEKTVINRSGDTVNVLIGTDDYDEKETVIDLTKGEYAGAKEVVISIPARVATSYLAKDIRVILSDMYVKFNPTAFNVSKLYEAKDKDKSGVKFKIGINQKNDSTSLSNEYELKADVFIGADNTSIDYLKNNMEISLDFDSAKADLRRMRNISLRRYDEYKSEWTYVKQRMDNYSTSINSPVNRLGRYSIIGSRR